MTTGTQRTAHRQLTSPRKGFALGYLMAILVSLCAIGSMAADWGRVQLAKAELQRAADASARYAVTGLRRGGSYSLARERAKEVALANLADGQPVVLQDGDIRFGRWEDGIFTECAEDAYPRPNAVRVIAQRTDERQNALQLTWASLVGAFTCDVTADTVAITRSGYGLVGLDSVKIAGNGSTDSYDPQAGVYSPTNRRDRGTVVSNKAIILAGNAMINGEAHLGAGYTLDGDLTAVTGGASTLSSALRFTPATVPPGAIDLGTVKLSQTTMTLAGGDYLIDDLSISGPARLTFTGPVRLYVQGSFSMTGGTVETWQSKAANLEINMTTSAAVSLSGQADLYARIYAPLSSVTQSGQAEIYGGIIARTLEFTGSWKGGVHYDESLGWDLNLITTVE